MIKARRDLALRGGIGAQFVRDDPFWHETPAFHQFDQKPLGRALVSLGLKDLLKNQAVLVDGAPEPV